MKFTGGTRQSKEGYQYHYPQEIIEVQRHDGAMTLFAPYGKQIERSDSIGSGMMTVRISSLSPNVISVRLTNYKGSRAKSAAFQLNSRAVTPVSAETEEEYVLVSGSMEARVSKSGEFGITFLYNGRILTSTGRPGTAYVSDSSGHAFIRERLNIDVGESIYGLGEHFTPFIRNGQSIAMWNEDDGADADRSSKNIPFLLSSRTYGVFVNSTDRIEYEVAGECPTGTQFSVPGETMEYLVIAGDSTKHVISLYADLVGKPSLPPAWSFGLSLSTSYLPDSDENTVLDFVDGMIERGIPLSVFHFDAFWMKGFEWTSFLWDRDRYPDPAALIRKLHDRGVRVCLWVSPCIGQKSPLFQEGLDGNYFINTGSGDVFQSDFLQAGTAMIDFSNLVAKAWFQKQLDDLIKIGVDTFETALGECAPTADLFYGQTASREGISYKNGLDAASMHNYYSLLLNEAVFEVLEKRHGKNNACLFAHSATVGSQKLPTCITDVNQSTYPALAETLRGGLSLSLSGFGFWANNIGGLGDDCDPDLYMRWFQFGLLCSHSRLHGNNQYKVPWMFGEDAVEVARLFTRLKLGMMPYLFSAAVEASTIGIPVVRPMMLEFPNDEICHGLDRQYMLGPSLLCAPIMNAAGTVRYYVPKGTWTNILTRDRIEGPVWRNEKHDYFTLPILARENTILITGKNDDAAEYDFMDSVTITIFELLENRQAAVDVFSSDVHKSGAVRALRKDGRIIVETEGLKGACRLLLTNIFRIKSSSQGIPEINEWGTLFVFNAGRIEIDLL